MFILRSATAIGGGTDFASSSGSLIRSVACLGLPILCLGLLSTLALVGLFATMITASVYVSMNC